MFMCTVCSRVCNQGCDIGSAAVNVCDVRNFVLHLVDPCRQQFLDCGGCAMLADVLSECSQIPVGSLHARYKAVACGATFNVCNDNGVFPPHAKHVTSFYTLTFCFVNLSEAVSAGMIKEKAVEHLTALLSKVDEEESVILGGIRAIMGLVDTSEWGTSSSSLKCF